MRYSRHTSSPGRTAGATTAGVGCLVLIAYVVQFLFWAGLIVLVFWLLNHFGVIG